MRRQCPGVTAVTSRTTIDPLGRESSDMRDKTASVASIVIYTKRELPHHARIPVRRKNGFRLTSEGPRFGRGYQFSLVVSDQSCYVFAQRGFARTLHCSSFVIARLVRATQFPSPRQRKMAHPDTLSRAPGDDSGERRGGVRKFRCSRETIIRGLVRLLRWCALWSESAAKRRIRCYSLLKSLL